MDRVDQSSFEAALTASIEERFFAPLKRNAFAARTWFTVTLAAILCLYVLAFGYFLYRDSHKPIEVAKQDETPVEIVVEKPPAPPKPPPPVKRPETPKPPPKAELEKPASSAPRAPSVEKVDTEQSQKENHAPKAAARPSDGKPEPAKEASTPETKPADRDETNAEAEKKPDTLQKDAEALDKLEPEPKKPDKKVARAKPVTKAHHAKAALKQLAGASMLPDYSFAKPTKKSPVYGGTEDSRYLAIVYGMIMAHRHPIPTPEAGSVTISFEVDDDGNVIGIGLARASGYPDVDAEAIDAIQRAAPFPPPPPGAPHGLVATIDFARAAPDYTFGER